MKYYLTKKEKRMIALERSYRNERAGSGFIAILLGLPILTCALIIANSRIRFPTSPYDIPINMDFFSRYGFLFMIFIFLAYRAHTKLRMIKHLKHHIEDESMTSEQSVPGYPPQGVGSPEP